MLIGQDKADDEDADSYNDVYTLIYIYIHSGKIGTMMVVNLARN